MAPSCVADRDFSVSAVGITKTRGNNLVRSVASVDTKLRNGLPPRVSRDRRSSQKRFLRGGADESLVLNEHFLRQTREVKNA